MSSTSPIKRNRKRTSPAYDYFLETEIQGKTKRKCVNPNCGKSYEMSTSTGILTSHAQKHGYLCRVNRMKISTSGTITNPTTEPKEQRNERIQKTLIRFIVKANLPFSIVENVELLRLLQIFDRQYELPNRRQISDRVLAEYESKKIKMKSYLHASKAKVSLTADAWSSSVFKGYITITAHWIDAEWEFQSAVISFQRFLTPHTGRSMCDLLLGVIKDWDLGDRLLAVTTDNASDSCLGMTRLSESLSTSAPANSQLIHVRCVAHVLNLAVTDCLQDVHEQIGKIRQLILAIRNSTKRRGLFDKLKRLRGDERSRGTGTTQGFDENGVPCLDVETRWSSTFTMVKASIKVKHILMDMTQRVSQLGAYRITEEEWHRAEKICGFLETAAKMAEISSGSTDVSLSITAVAYKVMIRRCRTIVSAGDPILGPISQKMLHKLEAYESTLCSDSCSLAKILDPRFASDVIADSDLLRQYFTQYREEDCSSTSLNVTTSNRCKPVGFLQELLDEDSIDMGEQDEVSQFLRATSSSNRGIDPLIWWQANETRYPKIASLARDFLAIQASSVASESTFSHSALVVTDRRTGLRDDLIQSCILLKNWLRYEF